MLSRAVGPLQVTRNDGITRLEGASITLQLNNISDGVCYWEEKPSSEKLADVNSQLRDVSDRSIPLSSDVCLEASRHVIRELACASPQRDGKKFRFSKMTYDLLNIFHSP